MLVNGSGRRLSNHHARAIPLPSTLEPLSPAPEMMHQSAAVIGASEGNTATNPLNLNNSAGTLIHRPQ